MNLTRIKVCQCCTMQICSDFSSITRIRYQRIHKYLIDGGFEYVEFIHNTEKMELFFFYLPEENNECILNNLQKYHEYQDIITIKLKTQSILVIAPHK